MTPSLRAMWRRLAPEPARCFRWDRGASIALRTMHLVAISMVLGGYYWGVDPVRLRPALALAAVSGLGLAGLEMYKTMHWLALGKGLFVLAKLGLLAALPLAGVAAVPLLLVVVVLASVGAHMPSRYRHYSILLGRPLRSAPKPGDDLSRGPRT
ncbi:MAG: hypothetical protein IT352_14460 [Gemmatimonadales bacterium]|nr:hypothetical protein [Gemmatimonadales bacterium]